MKETSVDRAYDLSNRIMEALDSLKDLSTNDIEEINKQAEELFKITITFDSAVPKESIIRLNVLNKKIERKIARRSNEGKSRKARAMQAEMNRLKTAVEKAGENLEGKLAEVHRGPSGGATGTTPFADQLRSLIEKGITEDALRRIIDDRYEELSKDARKIMIDPLSGPITFFLGPYAKISPNFMRYEAGFKIDDSELYQLLASEISKLIKEKPDAVEIPTAALMFLAISRTLSDYLGLPQNNPRSRIEWDAIYIEHNPAAYAEGRSTTVSIKQFKGKSMAQCMENSAVAHNMLLLLGYESTMISANKCELGGPRQDGHVYVLAKADGVNILFDQVNPFETHDKAGNFVGFKVALHQLTDDEVGTLMKGGRVEVDHPIFNQDGSVLKQVKWAYSGPYMPWQPQQN